MQLRVGMALKWRGEQWVCTRMDRYEAIYKAFDKSGDWAESEASKLSNVILAGPKVIEEFEAGDIVHRREVRATLECSTPGLRPNKFVYIYTYLTIRLLVKGEQDGTTGSTRGTTAQAEPTEATWQQLGGWESSWLEGVGETGDTADGAGSVQQDADNPGASEEGIHAAAHDGDSD